MSAQTEIQVQQRKKIDVILASSSNFKETFLPEDKRLHIEARKFGPVGNRFSASTEIWRVRNGYETVYLLSFFSPVRIP